MRFAVRTASFRFCSIQQHQCKFHSAINFPLKNKIMDPESYTIKDGMKIIERFFNLPLDYSNPNGEKIRVFARHVIPKSKAKTLEDEAKLPFLLYLEGGPGLEINDAPYKLVFTGKLHDHGYQTLWLDQRGTGLSTPLLPDTLPPNVTTDEQIAQYLKHFRADSIVKDCEAIRQLLLGDRSSPDERKWTIMGQSFGGFCAIHYISFYPEGIKEVFLTGGLAPLVDHPDPVYESLASQVIKRNILYYEKYPRDVKRVRTIAAYLDSNQVTLPNGGNLTLRRWQQLGLNMGLIGGIDDIHQLVLRASNDLELFNKLSFKTLQTIEKNQGFDGNPLYAILHESIYCQGRAANWSASRILKKYEQFSWSHVNVKGDSVPLFFIGEMMYPSMFDDYAHLRRWKGAAEILAKDDSWCDLYDLEQLSKNKVNVSAVTYLNDMYVDFNLAQETASKIKNTEQCITNQLLHDGVRKDPDVINILCKLSKREFN